MNFATGSVSRTFPSSTRIMTATLVTALLIEAIRKMASGRITRPASRSANPAESWSTTLPRRRGAGDPAVAGVFAQHRPHPFQPEWGHPDLLGPGGGQGLARKGSRGQQEHQKDGETGHGTTTALRETAQDTVRPPVRPSARPIWRIPGHRPYVIAIPRHGSQSLTPGTVSEAILEKLKAHFGDRYDVQKELGRGGMATVYLAVDVKHDRKIAIKVLHPELSASVGGERFEREIKLAAKLQHPHILGMFDSGNADGLLYYMMPFVEGESLRDKLDREGQLTIDEALQYTYEVAGALGFAHKQNIVHRDIKPENIMLSNGHALVADFGIARAVEESGGQKLTQTGMAVGTPVYMAPEQAVGEKVGPTADLYSLGCMLYEMLAGEPPFTGKNATQIMAKHAMEQPPSIRVVRQSVPEEVEEAIFAVLGKSPADRPQTAAAFCDILGTPLGATATMRAMGRTSTRRVPTGATRTYEAIQFEVPVWKKPWAIVLAFLVLAGGGFGAYWFGFRNAAPAIEVGGLDPKRIAVLYFEDVSTAKQLGYVADGLTEGLITALGQVQGLTVISRAGVDQFRGGTVSPDSIARALQTGTLVRGTVEQEGDKLRVGIRLLDGNSGADLERASFERSSVDLLGVRDSLAAQVAALIRSRVGTEVRLREQRSSTRNVEAWSLVQRAEQLRKSGEAAAASADTLARRRDFAAADSLLAMAERLDDKWADPSVLRGLVSYRWSRLSGRDQVLIKKHVDEGLAHVAQALAKDPGNPDALELRGNLNYWSWLIGLEPDSKKAETLLAGAQADLEAATQANPNQAGAWATLSHLYNQTGSGVDVNLAARRALEADAYLDNADLILSRLFLSSYDLGQFQDATHWCEETRRRFGDNYTAPRCELFMLTTRSREPDVARAWRLADSVVEMAPGPRKQFFRLNSNTLVAAVLARAGQTDSARRLAERSVGDAEVSPTRDLSLFAAFALLQAGDTTKAIDQLKIYFAANERMRTAYAQEPGWWFRGISEDGRYRQLVGGP
jgi:serine/threonine-protein kinase